MLASFLRHTKHYECYWRKSSSPEKFSTMHGANRVLNMYLLNEWMGIQFSSVSRVQLLVTPWITARQASLSITNSRRSLRVTSIESVMPSSHLILCCLLLLQPPIPPSIRVFFNESAPRMRWPKYWSFSFSISPSNEHPGLIIFRMDWLDLLAVQGLSRASSHQFFSAQLPL